MAFTLTLAAGRRVSLFPELAWHTAPAGTQSFVLLCHDPEAAGGDRAYWRRYDLPARLTSLPEGAGPLPGRLVREAPSHLALPGDMLYFELYALRIPTLCLPAEADGDAVETAMESHLLSRARLAALFDLAALFERNSCNDDRQPG